MNQNNISLEKVIRVLEHEIARANIADLEWLDCVEVALLRDALTLLKTQEPVKPKKIQNTVGFWCECGFFLGLRGGVKYCAMCGRAVKWG